jgi:hypothetical protein
MITLPASPRRAGSTLGRKIQGKITVLGRVGCSSLFEAKYHRLLKCDEIDADTVIFLDRSKETCTIRDARPAGGLFSQIGFCLPNKRPAWTSLPHQKRRIAKIIHRLHGGKVVFGWRLDADNENWRIVFRVPSAERAKIAAGMYGYLMFDA